MSPIHADFTIGQLAEQAGCTAEAVRFYEREGVLPAPTRRGGGRYRRYSTADVERVRFVRRARDLGFSLDEVRELLALAAGEPERSCDEVDAIARAHLAQVESKLAQLTALRDELSGVIADCRGGVGIGDCRIIGALSGHDAG
ncbi:MAG TPA: helix-turn-helix domain-containing protein [Gemmatimonadaceae bacterium]|nr:helix-turn-helix domain-containing protein [Gemmatimonadaceae bacterium]